MAQLLNRATIYGWLLILAALQSTDGEDGEDGEQDPIDFVQRCPLPVMLADLEERRIVAIGATLATMLAIDEQFDPARLNNDPMLFRSLCELLRRGIVDAYEARRELNKGDGGQIEVDVWASVTLDPTRQRGIWLISPVGAEPGSPGEGGCPPHLWPSNPPGVTVGVFDSSWQIEQLSDDAGRLFGSRPSVVVGSSMLEHLHPDDAADFLAAVGQSLATRGGVAVDARLLQPSGDPLAASLMITPLAGGALQFGFVATPVPDASSDSEDLRERVAVLERRFRRIAQEVEAAGFVAGAQRPPDVADQPGLAELSARQWEIVARLVSGERVPGIAQAMFVNQSTIRSHLSAIYRRLGVHSQAELLALLRNHPPPP